jgi:hypothetical protein
MYVLLMKRAAQIGSLAFVFSSLEGGLFAAGPSLSSTSDLPVTSGNRSVFLNGIDISSARSQDLRNAHIKITESGDVYITAPQYQVTEEETFMPLSSYSSKPPMPEHKPPQAMSAPKSAWEGNERSAKPGGDAPVTVPKSASANPLPAQPASTNPPKSGG